MDKKLPIDLKEAEKLLADSISKTLSTKKYSRISVQLLFEGLKLTPIVIRLANKLINLDFNPYLLFTDFGSSALAQRDYPNLKDNICTFKNFDNENFNSDENNILLAVSPQPYNFDEFSSLTKLIDNPIIMLNGKLEDTVVGIGSVGRDRRFNFLSTWKICYWLQPLSKAAITYNYEIGWDLYIQEDTGFRYVRTFDKKPDNEIIESYIY